MQYGFSHAGPGDPAGINGRWLTDGYNPYDYSEDLEINPFSLGAFNAGHPLMAGVTVLNSNFANIVTPNPAATEVAQNNLGESLVAFRPVVRTLQLVLQPTSEALLRKTEIGGR